MPIIRSFRGVSPTIHDSAFVADNVTVVGDVHIGERSSIWYGTVLRGDVHYIRIGSETSIQDNTVVHVTYDRFSVEVGDRVTIGHSVTLHGCTVASHCIIGMGSTILDQVEVGDHCIIGAGSLLTPGTKIPPGHLVVGSPGRIKRPLSPDELSWIEYSADHYIELCEIYRAEAAFQPGDLPKRG